MSHVPAALRLAVRQRAADRCEYCGLPQSADITTLQMEHIIPHQHRGKTELTNLALACLSCNVHKGPNLAGFDPETGHMVRLFDPRRQIWEKHFRYAGAELLGLTDIGRATIDVLAINVPENLMPRAVLMAAGEWST